MTTRATALRNLRLARRVLGVRRALFRWLAQNGPATRRQIHGAHITASRQLLDYVLRQQYRAGRIRRAAHKPTGHEHFVINP